MPKIANTRIPVIIVTGTRVLKIPIFSASRLGSVLPNIDDVFIIASCREYVSSKRLRAIDDLTYRVKCKGWVDTFQNCIQLEIEVCVMGQT